MKKNNSGSQRLDLLLVARGLASTRTKAQALIAEGKVLVGGIVASAAGAKFLADAEISLTEPEYPYVSRGGLKLAAALDAFSVDPAGRRALDIGQSTGGFTHCLLLRGAAGVVGVDVGHGQLADELREDRRVSSFERQDARDLDPMSLGAPFTLIVADLSFISLTLVLPRILECLTDAGDVILLVKPQFELTPAEIGSGGIVRDVASRERALGRVQDCARRLGLTVAGTIHSPVAGGDGNQEYLVHLRGPSSGKGF